MRLTAVLLLVACAALAVVCAITAYQAGGPGAFEVLSCIGIIFVLARVVPACWRRDGPVHQGGDDGHLRLMPETERILLHESERDLPDYEQTGTYPAATDSTPS